jgi:hypothetical protein
MGREVHKAKIQGRTRYAMLSTVTMDYATPFMPRNLLVTQMKTEGFKLPVISQMFKEATKVKKVRGKQEVSYPVIRLGFNPLTKS